ncbi:MAG: nicotinate-nucleotide--dimethylbenzimidazole phosphoribosyltransferase [Eubacterium sp.]|nr:nicotinate-nucleotide--dimethylbenzimidazole phosphoribosyltransferase [Eubacterium sp.]
MEEKIAELAASIDPSDTQAMDAARDRQVTLAKVPGSLGKLEDISVKLAGITGKVKDIDVTKQCIAIFSADNGVVKSGVASAPQSVTQSQTINFTRRITGMSSQARYFGIDVLVTDMGVAGEIPEALYTDKMVIDGKIPVQIVNRSLGKGTEDLSAGPAMTREQAMKAILTGFEAADAMKEAGVTLCGIGEMGIGNTTTSSCLLKALTGLPAEDLVGRGGGLNDEGLAAKVKIVGERGAAATDLDPIDKLALVGGFDICAMAGCFLGAAKNHIPAVIDGFISIAAACMAREFNPAVTDYMFASHKSKEIGYIAAIERLGLEPMFDLGMRLGEGSGCPIAFKIIEAAEASMSLMKTLAEGAIDAEYLEEIKRGHYLD